MADAIETVEEQGFGSSLMESIKGVAIGGILFLVSFIVLWMNEGRTDLSEVAKKSVAANAAAVDKATDGKFVSVTGELKTTEQLEDPELLKPGTYLRLDRKVEMFAWIEKSETKTKKKLGGGKTKTTKIWYEKQWTDSPDPPSEFTEPTGHENPPLPIQADSWKAKTGNVGPYAFDPSTASLPAAEALSITDAMVKTAEAPAAAPADKAEGEGDKAAPAEEKKADDEAAEDDGGKGKKKDKAAKKKRHGRKVVKKGGRIPAPTEAQKDRAETRAAAIAANKPASYTRADDTYLFRGTGSVGSPQVGDVRISFRALKPGAQVTLFGQQQGDKVIAHTSTKDDVTMYRALNGTRDQAIKQLSDEHKTVGWILRIVGFVLMWVGLTMFFGPINALLDVVPFLGSAGRFLIGIAMFPVALVLSLITIVLSMIAHSPILLTLFILALAGGGYFLYQKKKKTAA